MNIEFGLAERDALTTAFFEGAAEGRLLVPHCPDCGRSHAPQVMRCIDCGAHPLQWREVSGHGSIVSWGVAHPRRADGASARPALLGLIELDEGPWLHARIDASAPDFRVGSRVRVAFHHPQEGESLPYFRPV